MNMANVVEAAQQAWRNLGGLSVGEARTLYLTAFGRILRTPGGVGCAMIGTYTAECSQAQLVEDAILTAQEVARADD